MTEASPIGVRVVAPTGVGHGTKVINAATGEEVKGIARLNIAIVPGDITRIEAEIFSTGVDVSGEMSLYVADPATGEAKRPCRIEFDDGTFWQAA